MPIRCPGRCNSEHSPVTWGDPVWCANCALVARRALRSLPQAYDALDSLRFTGAPAAWGATRVSGSPPPRSLGPGVELRDEIYHTARSWEDDVRHCLGHDSGVDGSSREETLAAACSYLNSNFVFAISRELGGLEFGVGAITLLQLALKKLKNDFSTHILIMPCPSCGMRSLVTQEGVAKEPWFTVCEQRLGGCGRQLSEEEMDGVAFRALVVLA